MTAKPSLRERIATLKAEKEAKVAAPASKFSAKEAKTRVAASWTIAKTLLPSAPSEVQYKLASSLLGNTTNALTAIVRQAAVNAHWTKVAEKFEEMHKVELNELIEDPSLLNKMNNEVEKELKGEAKNASADCKCGEEGCAPCKTAAPEDEMPMEEAPVEEAPAEEMPMEEAPVEEAPLDADAAPADAPVSPAENKKDILVEQIQTIKDDVAALEEEVTEGEELDFSAIFDEEGMEDKADNLANEDEDFDGDIEASGEGFFAPSDAGDLEGAMDADGMDFADASDFFSHSASVDSMDDLFAGEAKTAAKDDVIAPGEMGDKIVSKGNEADAESDHEDNILFEILGDIKAVAYEDGEYKRTTEPKFEKAASAKKTPAPAVKRPIRSLGNVKTAAPSQSVEKTALASLVFPDDELFG